MALNSLVWKLASPYDAYVSHVARLNAAIERVQYFSERAQGYEAGLQSSGPSAAGASDPAERTRRFREQLGAAAAKMTDEEFEDFVAHLGGGSAANAEADRANAASRLSTTTRGLEEYFAIAGQELATLEKRGYNPGRADVARQLRENHLPGTTLPEYRHLLHELGSRAGQTAKA